MAIKYKADLTLLIRRCEKIKSYKLELFRGSKFGSREFPGPANKWRLRVGGKWYGNKHTYLSYFTMEEIMEMIKNSFIEALK